ncbi:hypothetical protein BHE74_00012743, partial [Ensete ventricosum]
KMSDTLNEKALFYFCLTLFIYEFHLPCQRKEVRHDISRSLSLPIDIKSKSIKRMNSIGSVFRVIPSTPRVVDLSSPVADSITPIDSGILSSIFVIQLFS